MAPKTKKSEEGVAIIDVSSETISFNVIGTSPLICNSMSAKTQLDLLFPPKKKRGGNADTLKHDPGNEFNNSIYRSSSDDAPTLIEVLSTSFKKAMAGAATDLPGVAKAQVGRLCYVEGDRISIYGVPQIFMSVVRTAGIQKTPDIRTRAIIPRWAAKVTVSFTTPQLSRNEVAKLLGIAGMLQGIGDWRPEKGSGSYGRFAVVTPNTQAEFDDIVKTGGRLAQVEAMQAPDIYDEETRMLLGEFEQRIKDSGREKDLTYVSVWKGSTLVGA